MVTPSAAPRLIVNGDDLGRTVSNTSGIIEAYRSGILTSTSVVATGPAFDLGVKLAHENPGLGVGAHLFLNEYLPVSRPQQIPTLVRRDGSFYPQVACFARIALGLVRRRDVRLEWEAQLRRIIDAGIQPTHIDGHCHIHAHPLLTGVVHEIAGQFGIRSVRMPSESITAGSCRSWQRYVETVVTGCACWRGKFAWAGRLRFPDRFYGFMQGGQMTRPALDTVASSLASGVSELMVHPGLSNDDRPYNNGYDWMGDLATATAYRRDEFERRFGVKLASYRDAWA